MKFEDVYRLVGGIPFISPRKARYLYDMIVRGGRDRVLGLAVAHGTATCYIAAALDELGRGRVTAVDLVAARDEFDPAAEDLVARCGLQDRVEIVRMQTGYNWFLHDMIRRRTEAGTCRPCYDLCILDGAKNWTIDGAAFFFVDKLLKDGGRIIFDDYAWTYAAADQRRDATDGITHRSLSADELNTPHVKEIVDLLVLPHPDYGKVTMLDDAEWVVAEKAAASGRKVVELARTITVEEMIVRALALVRRGSRDAARG